VTRSCRANGPNRYMRNRTWPEPDSSQTESHRLVCQVSGLISDVVSFTRSVVWVPPEALFGHSSRSGYPEELER
jgi:hypothetical protein